MEKKALANRFRAEVDRHRKEVRQFLADIDRKIDHLIELHRDFRNTMPRCGYGNPTQEGDDQ